MMVNYNPSNEISLFLLKLCLITMLYHSTVNAHLGHAISLKTLYGMIHTGSVGNTHLWLLQASSACYSVSICFSFILSSDHLATRVLWIMDFFRTSKVHSLQSYDTLNSSLLFYKASVISCYLIRIFFQASVS